MSCSKEKSKARRIFFALCPDEQVRQQLWQLSSELQHGKRTSIENLHITLIFLGAVTKEQSICLEQAASKLQSPSFTLQIDRLDYWARPKTLWAGCVEVSNVLQSLVRQLQKNVEDCGFPKAQQKNYIPHVSLARKVSAGQGKSFCEQHEPIEPIEWNVKHFCLMESITYAEGPVYKVLRSW